MFLAHSTTQATNALLEGDVAPVGVLAMAGASGRRAGGEAGPHRSNRAGAGRACCATANRFLVTDAMSEADVREAIAALVAEGAQVLVASSAFGVDNTGSEELVRRLGSEAGLLTTCGHEITRLYGLTTRTRTAVINASILPRMIATATMTEASVREAGIVAPLMIMRGDGGVMNIDEMRRRPVMTMLSGPAASVAGALMHLRVSDGLYFEVGGTSTNIGVIRNGRPTVTYARVGGHETYVSSLDVRVIGIAGGSLVRATPGRIDRMSARAAPTSPGCRMRHSRTQAQIVDPRIELFEPKPETATTMSRCGSRAAPATRSPSPARPMRSATPGPACTRMAIRARRGAHLRRSRTLLGLGVEETARAVLDAASDKLIPVVQGLIEEYELDPDQRLLIGEGGGAGALIPYISERLGLGCEISRDAEVISSIGAALALVRDVVERIIPHPQPEDLQAIRREALEAAVRVGADARSVEVTVEVDQQTHRVRAIAVGAAEMHAKDLGGSITEREARAIAAGSMGASRRDADALPRRRRACASIVPPASGSAACAQSTAQVRSASSAAGRWCARRRRERPPRTSRASGRRPRRDEDGRRRRARPVPALRGPRGRPLGRGDAGASHRLAASELEKMDGDAPVVLVGVPAARGSVG